MSLIIFGKDESEWISLRKRLIREGNSISDTPEFLEVHKLLTNIPKIQHSSIDKLMNQVFSPLISHFLIYSQKQYKVNDKQMLNQFLKDSIKITSTLEKVKPSRAVEDFVESILSTNNRYYSNKEKKIYVEREEGIVIPLTSSLDTGTIVLRNEDDKNQDKDRQVNKNKDKKQGDDEFWISQSQQESEGESKRVKLNKDYHPIFAQLLQLFLTEYHIDSSSLNHALLFYLRVIRDCQINKLIYKCHLASIYLKIRQTLEEKLNNITQQGLKEDSLQTLLTKDSILFGLSKADEKKFILSLTFLYQTKLMNSINVHSRLKGCALLSDFCDQLMYQHRVNQDINFYGKKLMNERIIQKIFTLDTNEQILAKSQKLFKFMVRASYLTNDNLRQILHLAFKGNNNQRRIVLDYISGVIIRFSLEHIDIINKIVMQTPLPEFTLEMVKLIYSIGKYVPGNNLKNTYDFFWSIICSFQKYSQLKIECRSPIVDGFSQILQKMLQTKTLSIQQVINSLTTPQSNYIMFQILNKFINALPELTLHQKYLRFGIVKIDALKYLVEKAQYQNHLIVVIKQNPYTASDYISFLTTMIEGYRPYSQNYLGVEILTNLTNQPVMFESLLMYYKSDLVELFQLLVENVENTYQFECLKKVFVMIHKLEDDKPENPHLLEGFDILFGIILKAKNVEVKREGAVFCIELIYNYYNRLNIQDKLELQSFLVDNIINQLQKVKTETEKLGCLIYIEELLNQTEIEGVGILRSHGNLIPTKFVTIIATNQTFNYSSGNRDISIRINSNSSLYELLEKIAFEFKTNPEQINVCNDAGSIKNRQNSKTIEQLGLSGTNITVRSIFKPQICKSPLLQTSDNFQRVLTNKAAQVFSQIFYRYASQGFMGKPQLSNLMKIAADDQYDYDINLIISQFDHDKDQKLSYDEFMYWMVDNSRYRQNQMRKILESLRYRPDLVKYGQSKIDHTKTIRYYLFEKETIYPILFNLIASQDKELRDISKRLLTRLTTYKKAIDWLDDIKTENEFILWYQLLLIEYLLQGSSEDLFQVICKNINIQEWRDKFIKQEYKKLLLIIDNLMKEGITQQESESVYLALKIISKLSLIPYLSSASQNTSISKYVMLELDHQKIQEIRDKGYHLPVSIQNIEAYLGLMLHYPVLLDFDEFIFHQDSEIRRATSYYMFFHRKVWGKEKDLFEKKIEGECCLDYYDVVVREIASAQGEGYEGLYPVVEKVFVQATNQHLMTAMLRIIKLLITLFPSTYSTHPQIQQILLSKYKSLPTDSLSLAYDILSQTNLSSLILYFTQYLSPLQIPDRTPQLNTNASNFVGLKNLGCICYMNAMIQQLYLTKQFHSKIMDKQGKTPKGIVYQLKRMFNYLDKSNRLDYNPKDFCFAFDKDIKVHVQEDTEEFVNKMFDRLEGDCPELIEGIESQFGGKTISVRHCPCGATVTREEKFFHLTVEVKDCHTLTQSLNKFITPEVIPDVYCESCKTKKQISRSTYLSSLPETLIVHLQRMTFDLETLVRIKLHNYLEFPNQIQFQPYMYEKKQDETEGYLLKGVIIHTGNPDGGHYYSLRKLEGKWYKFDDSLVSEFRGDFNKECYGGDYDYGDYHVKSSKNAYILVYERRKEQGNKDGNNGQEVVDCEFAKEVKSNNTVFERELRFYNKSFSKFISTVSSKLTIPKDYQITNGSTEESSKIQSLLSLLLRYIQLSTEIPQSFFAELQKYLIVLISLSSPQYSFQQLTYLDTNKEQIYKKLTESPNQEVRKAYKVIISNIITKEYSKNYEIIDKFLEYLFSEKLYQKVEIHKVIELFELQLQLVLSQQKSQTGELLSHNVITICFNNNIKCLTSKYLQKYQKHKAVPVKTLILQILNLSLLQISDNSLKIPESLYSEFRSPEFYKKVIQDDQKLINRLGLIACQLIDDNEKLTETLLSTFLTFPAEQYSLVVPSFLSINDSLQERRIQILFGVPQRINLHSNPYQFSLKSTSTSSLYTNIIHYSSCSSEYKTILQTICQSSNYPNKQTTILIELLLSSMIEYEEVFKYVMALSPPSYKYGGVIDVVHEYLQKMEQIEDRKEEVVRGLYLKVQEIIQREMKELSERQDEDKNGVELDSVYPLSIIGKTTEVEDLEPLELEQEECYVKIQQKILKTYQMRSKPTIQQNLSFSSKSIQNRNSSLNKYFISLPATNNNSNQIQGWKLQEQGQQPQNQPDSEAFIPTQTLLVIKTTSNCTFRITLTSSSLNVKFIVAHQSNYINFPYQMTNDLSIGVEILKGNKFNSFAGMKEVAEPRGDKRGNERPKQDKSVEFVSAATYFDDAKGGEQSGNGGAGDELVDGIICKGCTYLNPFTQQKCQMCEGELF